VDKSSGLLHGNAVLLPVLGNGEAAKMNEKALSLAN